MKNYDMIQIDSAYIIALYDLISACTAYHVELNEVKAYMGGFRVTFKGFEGDAICHDGSYGSPCSPWGATEDPHRNAWEWDKEPEAMWETIGFPWDYGDVSIHDSISLAAMLNALKTGHDWGRYDRKDLSF